MKSPGRVGWLMEKAGIEIYDTKVLYSSLEVRIQPKKLGRYQLKALVEEPSFIRLEFDEAEGDFLLYFDLTEEDQ